VRSSRQAFGAGAIRLRTDFRSDATKQNAASYSSLSTGSSLGVASKGNRTLVRSIEYLQKPRADLRCQWPNACRVSSCMRLDDAARRSVRLERGTRFAHDSLVEGDGFELPVPARDRSRRAAVQKTLGVARQPFEQVQLVIEFRARRRIAVRQIQASDDQAADGRLDGAAMRII
jgi:hypothetical protein